MKKIIVALILALMSLVAYGQTTKGEIWDNFKQGGFYLITNEDSDILFFKVDFDTGEVFYTLHFDDAEDA